MAKKKLISAKRATQKPKSIAKAAKNKQKLKTSARSEVIRKSRVSAKPALRAKPKAMKPAPAAKSAGRAKSTQTPRAAIGRPRISGDEKLYLLFKEDYHARQIFEFLRVETIRDLEQHSPNEIFRRLTIPIQQTLTRIRSKLANYHRHLLEDADFLLEQIAKQQKNANP